jgi:lipoprotein NlpD
VAPENNLAQHTLFFIRLIMNYTKLGTALCAGSLLSLSGCGILETVDIPEIRFDSNTYVVQPGDTLESVADRYEVDAASLVAVNALEVTRLVPGQRLLLVRQDDPSARLLQPRAVVESTQPLTAGNGALVESSGEEIVAIRNQDSLLVDEPVITEAGQVSPLPQAPLIDDMKADGGQVVEVERPEGVETIIDDVRVGEAPSQIEVVDSVVPPTPPAPAIPVADINADGWSWPAKGVITREFNLQEINRQGLDIDAGVGANVQAAADGEVVYSGRDLASYGNLVILRHEDNFLTAYSKVSDIFVKENQKVKAGEVIAAVGTDQTAGTELHFEIRRNGEPVNPVEYLPPL